MPGSNAVLSWVMAQQGRAKRSRAREGRAEWGGAEWHEAERSLVQYCGVQYCGVGGPSAVEVKGKLPGLNIQVLA